MYHDWPIKPQEVLQLLRQYRWRWLGPAAAVFLATATLSLLRNSTWEASQALVLREEGVGSGQRLGRFDSMDAMKTAQETIMEVSKSDAVLRATLAELDGVHPEKVKRTAIEGMRGEIRIKAPKGIEFGKSEVFYVSTKSSSRERAIELTRLISRQIDLQLRQLRKRRAESLVGELRESVTLATQQLDDATARLSRFETQLGSDLAEMRILNESTSGDSNLRRTLTEVQAELRQASLDLQTYDQLLKQLRAAQTDPQQLVATPNHLLQAQPALQRLKDGLVDAQLRAAQLLGELSLDHPRVRAAMTAQDEIASRLHIELASAINGIEAQQRIVESRRTLLQSQKAELDNRMKGLAEGRPTYANLASEVRNRTDILKQQQHELAQAIASRDAAGSSSLLTQIDEPTTGDRPVGPGFFMFAAAGAFGGLAIGMGVFFLTVPIPGLARIFDRRRQPSGGSYFAHAWPFGRRATDRAAGRRKDDMPAAASPSFDAPAGVERRAQAPIQPRRREDDRRSARFEEQVGNAAPSRLEERLTQQAAVRSAWSGVPTSPENKPNANVRPASQRSPEPASPHTNAHALPRTSDAEHAIAASASFTSASAAPAATAEAHSMNEAASWGRPAPSGRLTSSAFAGAMGLLDGHPNDGEAGVASASRSAEAPQNDFRSRSASSPFELEDEGPLLMEGEEDRGAFDGRAADNRGWQHFPHQASNFESNSVLEPADGDGFFDPADANAEPTEDVMWVRLAGPFAKHVVTLKKAAMNFLCIHPSWN